jgi:hypothetical protein
MLSAANRGERPVTVGPPFMQLPDGSTLVFTGGFRHQDATFPKRLEPGDGCFVLIEIPDLVSGIVRGGVSAPIELRGAFRDKTGRVYTSRPFIFDPREWIGRRDSES